MECVANSWIKCEDRLPDGSGRYWVFPYVHFSGYHTVNMADFKDGDWEKTHRSQKYKYWKAVTAPDAPEVIDHECQ